MLIEIKIDDETLVVRDVPASTAAALDAWLARSPRRARDGETAGTAIGKAVDEAIRELLLKVVDAAPPAELAAQRDSFHAARSRAVGDPR